MNHEIHEKHEKLLKGYFDGMGLTYKFWCIPKSTNNTDGKPTIFVLFVCFVVDDLRSVLWLWHRSQILIYLRRLPRKTTHKYERKIKRKEYAKAGNIIKREKQLMFIAFYEVLSKERPEYKKR